MRLVWELWRAVVIFSLGLVVSWMNSMSASLGLVGFIVGSVVVVLIIVLHNGWLDKKYPKDKYADGL